MEVSRTEFKHCDLFSIVGRVDSFTATKFSEALAEATKGGRYNVVLDFSKVDYVSSAGLRVMIDAQKTCKQIGRGEVILVGVPKRIFDTLELAGFVPLFKFFDDATSAVAHF